MILKSDTFSYFLLFFSGDCWLVQFNSSCSASLSKGGLSRSNWCWGEHPQRILFFFSDTQHKVPTFFGYCFFIFMIWHFGTCLFQLVPKLTRNFLKEGYMEKTGPRASKPFIWELIILFLSVSLVSSFFSFSSSTASHFCFIYVDHF